MAYFYRMKRLNTSVYAYCGSLFLLCLSAAPVMGQYYYKDILNTRQVQAEKKILQEKQIRSIKIHSFEPDGSESEGFFCEKKISKDYRKFETVTRAANTGKSILTAFYNAKGLLEKTVDSSELSVNYSLYEYDGNNNIVSVTSTSSSSDDNFNTTITEVHKYFYNEKGLPQKMLRIKNSTDSTLVDFISDDKGNITDEIERSPRGRHYYYYYNADNRLTDIVRYNAIKKQLRADFIFEYDDEGQLIQMVVVEDGAGSDYYTWKYVYNEGLRIIEKCFAKNKSLMGYVEYEYD